MDSRYLKEGYNVKNILGQFALEHKVDELSLDYSLVSYKTYLQKDDKTNLNNLIDVDENVLKQIDASAINTFIDSPYKIVQRYTIDIFKRRSSFYPIIINVQSNDDNTSLKAMVDTSRIPDPKIIESSIKTTILNICAYRGIIIGLGWGNINASIREVSNKLKSSDKHPPYYEINIANLPAPKVNRIAIRKIISKNGKISALLHDSFLLNGGFFKVTKDEVLLEYQKPLYDSNWRNIYGILFGLNSEYPIGITAGNGIRINKLDDKILYYAKSNGYVSIVGNIMQVSDVIVIDNINTKNMINIQEQGIETLIVKNPNLTKEAVNAGVDLEVKNINIIGNLGAANLKASKISIKGQVHIKGNIVSDIAAISHLKGSLISNKAEVKVCENANIECNNLVLGNTSGSKIYVTRANIYNIQSNNTIFVQEDLLVGKMIGHNNEFILHPCIYGDAKDKYDNFSKKINNINRLQSIFMPFNDKLHYEFITNKFLYDELIKRDASIINASLFDWNKLLQKYKVNYENSQKIINKHDNLISSFNEKIEMIQKEILLEFNKMFNIKVVFNTICNNDFYVRIINFNGSSSRHHVNSKRDNNIKSFKLENDGSNIRIVLYKE